MINAFITIFIVGMVSVFLLNFSLLYGLLIFSIIFFTSFALVFKKQFTPSFLLGLCFILGYGYTTYYNNFKTYPLLQVPINFQKSFGTVEVVERSTYDNKSYIYLKDVITTTKTLDSTDFDNDNPNNIAPTVHIIPKVRVSYNIPHSLEIGDIIEATITLFPPSKSFYPFGFNFENTVKQKKLSAYGYIVGNIKVLENITEYSASHHDFINRFYVPTVSEYVKNKLTVDDSLSISRFFQAIIVGNYSFMPSEDIENLRKVSLVHFISISGYHIGIIAAIMFFLIRNILICIPNVYTYTDGKKISALLTILVLCLYAPIVQDHLPALRAIFMTCAFLIATLFSRHIFSFSTLLISCLIVLLINPFYIYSVSFLLSFIATLVLIWLYNNKNIHTLRKYLGYSFLGKTAFFFLLTIISTFCIEVIIAPILVFYFGNVPLLGIVANLIAAPIFSFIIMPTLVACVILPSFISSYLIKVTTIAFQFILDVAAYLSSFPWANLWFEFFPNYLLIIFLSSFFCFTYFRFKCSGLIFSFPMVGCILYYFLLYKPPDIVLLANNVGFIKVDDTYLLTNIKESKFAKQIWFKNPNTITADINASELANCDDIACVIKSKGKTVIYYKTNIRELEDCNIGEIIISSVKGECIKAKVINNSNIISPISISIK